MNDAVGKELLFPRAPPQLCFRRSGEERPDLGDGVFFDRGDRPLGNDIAALRAGLGPHFDDPVRFFQYLRVVVHEDHGVSVRNKIVHHAGQPHDVRGMQPDGRLVQHIQNAGRAVAHGAGQLHPLPLTGGERGRRAIQRQIAKPQIHQPLCRALERFADALRHGPHLLRQTAGDVLHPVYKLGERHGAGFVQRDAPQFRRAGGSGKARAAAVRADALFQKLLHALHALFVLYLGKGIFHGVDGVEIRKIQIAGLSGVFIMVEDVLLLRRAVEHDVLFFFRQLPERHVRAHAHFAADVRHQRPHQAVPRGDRALVDGKRLVRHERCHVHSMHRSRAAAPLAGSLRIERQFLGGRCVKMRAALRADELLARGDEQRRRYIVSVRAAVAGKTGIHEPQAVQKLRPCAEGAADARHAGALMQRQRRGNIQNLVHAGFGCLRHAAAGVGGECLEIAAGALRIQHAERERRLAGPGHARNADDLPERDVNVNILEIMDFRPADQHFIDHGFYSGFMLFLFLLGFRQILLKKAAACHCTMTPPERTGTFYRKSFSPLLPPVFRERPACWNC